MRPRGPIERAEKIMAVRVTVALVSDQYKQVTVEDATSFKTNATGGAGLIADLFDDESNTIATFGHVLYVETVNNEDDEKPDPQY
jgi:hypothetical protein